MQGARASKAPHQFEMAVRWYAPFQNSSSTTYSGFRSEVGTPVLLELKLVFSFINNLRVHNYAAEYGPPLLSQAVVSVSCTELSSGCAWKQCNGFYQDNPIRNGGFLCHLKRHISNNNGSSLKTKASLMSLPPCLNTRFNFCARGSSHAQVVQGAWEHAPICEIYRLGIRQMMEIAG